MAANYFKEKDAIKVPRFNEEAGFYTTKQRSKIMAKIKGKNSLPELLLRKALWAKNIRFRLHRKDLPGKPDITIQKYRLAVFVDGDFWHGYQWEQRKPKTNQAFWNPKIKRNMQRDNHITQSLQQMGYTVMRFWEHEIKNDVNLCTNQIILYIEAAKVIKIPTKG